MPWIESHTSLRGHPKVKRLSRALSLPNAAAIGHLHCLWHWATEYASDGDLSRFTEVEIAEAGMFDWSEYQELSPPDVGFLKALIDTGWIDESESGRFLHDWWEYSGGLMESRRQASDDGKRGNHKRWHLDRGVSDPTCPLCRVKDAPDVAPESPPDVAPDTKTDRPESHSTQQYTTQHDLTEPSSKPSSDAFEDFWTVYPERHTKKLAKGKAAEAWKRLKNTERDLAAVAVVHYRAACDQGLLAKDAFRWLRDRSFNDWQTPAEFATNSANGFRNSDEWTPEERGVRA